MVMVSPLIILKPKKSFVQKVLELQPKIFPFLATGATLAAGGAVLTALKVGLGAGIGAGILQTSVKARKFAVEKIKDPTKIGRGIGEIIEDPSKLLPKEKQPLSEKIKEIAKSAGLVAGGAAALAGGILVTKKAITKAKEIFPKKEAVLVSTQLPTEMVSQISAVAEPIGAVQPTPPLEEPKMVGAAPLLPKINIKNTFNPEISFKFSKSRKFINQQILIRK